MSLGGLSVSDEDFQGTTYHIAGSQYLLTGANLSLYTAASHIGAPGSLSWSAISLPRGTASIPSYNGKCGLQSPMVDIFDHSDVPEEVWAEGVVP